MKTPQTNLPQIQKDSLQQFVALLPHAFQKMNELLDDPETPALVKAHLVDVIFERVLGKTEQTFNLISHESNMDEASRQIETMMAKFDQDYRDNTGLTD